MRIYAVILVFLLPSLCLAQPGVDKGKFVQKEKERSLICGGLDSVLAKRGTWKKNEDYLVFADRSFPKSQYKFVFDRIDSMYGLVKKSLPSLNGFEPRWHRGIFGEPYIPNGPVPYSFQSMYYSFICDNFQKKIIVNDETFNWVYVFVNYVNWFMKFSDSLDINSDGKIKAVYTLPPVADTWKGLKVYELRGTPGHSARAVIIGRNGKLPWRSLTQKQYLTGMKIKIEKLLARSKPNSFSERDYTEQLNYINNYLATTNSETLDKVAFINPKATWGFKGEFGSENEGGYKLVLSGLGEVYFDKTLPRYVPQLIQFYWSYEYGSASQLFQKQLEENFPLEKLKAMIDK